MLESKIDDLKNTLPGTATNSIGGVEDSWSSTSSQKTYISLCVELSLQDRVQ